jgi:hypothetical protein
MGRVFLMSRPWVLSPEGLGLSWQGDFTVNCFLVLEELGDGRE